MNDSFKKLAPFKTIIKLAVNSCVNTWAKARSFSFPAKYPWQWKVEMLRNHYEKDTTDLFKKIILPGMTILDIGGHIGYFTRLFSRLAGPHGKVFAFEPDPYNFALLKKNTARLPNVTLVNAAVSDKKGIIDFYQIEDSTGCHTTIPTNAPAKKFSVDAVTIDDFGADFFPDVIKMDIEGGEPRALLGMKNLLASGRSLRIVMELNPEALGRSGTTASAVIASMKERGFIAYGILRGGARSTPISDIEGLQLYEGKSDYANVLFERLPSQS
ncbi:MAG: FkbM family methyltransferase [Patescibacteria group bacterium]